MAGNAQMQPQQQQQQQPPPQMATNPHPDHISQVRMLVQQLKESLSNLMRIAASNINHNTQIDTGSKTVEGKFKFDKALEDFFAITNQIERHLRTIADCAVQQKESQKYTPFVVSARLDATGPVEVTMPNEVATISYNQYMSIIRNQKNYIQSLQDILTDGAHKISHTEVPAVAAQAAVTAAMPAAGVAAVAPQAPAAAPTS